VKIVLAALTMSMIALVGQTNASSDASRGVSLTRLFSSVEMMQRSSSGFRTADELKGSPVWDQLANEGGTENPFSGVVKEMDRQDPSKPIPEWTVTVYPSPDRQHYLMRVVNASGSLQFYSDERGLIYEAKPLN
jgi:hypothetical protein